MGIGRAAKKSVVTVVGAALVVLGLALMVLPGPGLLVSVAGFAVLATEYAWAHRALEVTRKKAIDGQRQVARNKWTYTGQLICGVAMVAIAVAFLVWRDLPFASGATSTALVFGAAVLITSAVLARRRYRDVSETTS